jgi:hypothetical protein
LVLVASVVAVLVRVLPVVCAPPLSPPPLQPASAITPAVEPAMRRNFRRLGTVPGPDPVSSRPSSRSPPVRLPIGQLILGGLKKTSVSRPGEVRTTGVVRSARRARGTCVPSSLIRIEREPTASAAGLSDSQSVGRIATYMRLARPPFGLMTACASASLSLFRQSGVVSTIDDAGSARAGSIATPSVDRRSRLRRGFP